MHDRKDNDGFSQIAVIFHSDKEEANLLDKKDQTLFEAIDLSFLPYQVDVTDLKANGKLLDESEIKVFETKLASFNPGDRISKKNLQTKYGGIKLEDGCYAVYKGKEHNKHLGSGNFGKIKLVQNLKTGKWYCLKIWTLEDESKLEYFERELNKLILLGKAKNELIRKVNPSYKYRWNEGPHIYQFIFEYEPGCDLFKFMDHQRTALTKIPEIYWINIIIQALNAIKEVHAKGILHCDIHAENLMYDYATNRVKLIDFGIALTQEEAKIAKDKRLVGGRNGYIAPELERGASYSFQSDIFSMGRVCQDLLGYEELKYDGNNSYVTYMKNKLDTLPRMTFVKNMVKEIYVSDVRPSVDEAINYFTGIYQSIFPTSHATMGVINLSEYMASNNKDSFINAADFVNQVVIVDDRKCDNTWERTKAALNLKKTLEKHHITVKPQLLIADNMLSNIDKIPKHFGKSTEVNFINYFYITTSPAQMKIKETDKIRAIGVTQELANIKKEIAMHSWRVKNVDGVLDVLNKEMTRLTEKYHLQDANKKIIAKTSAAKAKLDVEHIQHTLLQINTKFKKGCVSYGFLLSELNSLREKLCIVKQEPSFAFLRFIGNLMGEHPVTLIVKQIEKEFDVELSQWYKPDKKAHLRTKEINY